MTSHHRSGQHNTQSCNRIGGSSSDNLKKRKNTNGYTFYFVLNQFCYLWGWEPEWISTSWCKRESTERRQRMSTTSSNTWLTPGQDAAKYHWCSHQPVADSIGSQLQGHFEHWILLSIVLFATANIALIWQFAKMSWYKSAND